MLRIFAIMAPSIAESISASSNTMKGALPPSSIAGLTTQSAASCSSLRPTSVEPVNDTTRTRGSCSIALTTLPEERDGMTLTTPAGTPASSRIGISASMVSGVSEAGLSTTGQPAASAGPILRVAIAAGKFHGVTRTATHAGLCWTKMRAALGGRRSDLAGGQRRRKFPRRDENRHPRRLVLDENAGAARRRHRVLAD